jgi:hypothetical protein
MNAQTGKFLLQDAKEGGTLVQARNGVRYSLGENAGGQLVLCLWAGKSTKPAQYGRVRNEAHGLEAVAQAVELASKVLARKAAEKAEKAENTRTAREALKVGTLLCNSWGYDQTNIDFYEVVNRSTSGATVRLRKIASETVKHTGYMSKDVKPCPGKFVGEAFKKCVGNYGVQFDHGWTSVTDPSDVHSSTSYH